MALSERILNSQEFGEMVLFDGFEDAFVGIAQRFNDWPIAVYDKSKVIATLMEDMTHEDAIEYFEFNVIGAWVGDNTPVFIEFVGDLDG